MTGASRPTGTRLSVAKAQTLASAALLAAGAAYDTAAAVAAHVVEAELAGHPSHGLRQVPVYCAKAGRPGCDLQAKPRVTRRRPTLTTIDAAGGLGYLALAVDCATTAAHKHAIATSAVLRCGHAGRAGAWAERGTRAGCVTIILLGGADPPFVVSAAPGPDPQLRIEGSGIGSRRPGRTQPGRGGRQHLGGFRPSGRTAATRADSASV